MVSDWIMRIRDERDGVRALTLVSVESRQTRPHVCSSRAGLLIKWIHPCTVLVRQETAAELAALLRPALPLQSADLCPEMCTRSLPFMDSEEKGLLYFLLAVWPCGRVDVWLCSCVAVWPCGWFYMNKRRVGWILREWSWQFFSYIKKNTSIWIDDSVMELMIKMFMKH